MRDLLSLLTTHPYLILLLSSVLERIGLPLFMSPVLVGAGALAASGHMHFDAGLWLALVACVAGDTIWYELGRHKGDSVLSILCRISLEPETCVRRSKGFFEKGVDRTLLLSKWIPGLSHIVPAVAGLSGIPRQRFFLINAAGSAIWIFALMLAGYLPVEHVHLAPALGPIFFEVALVLVVGNVGVKFMRRRRFIKDLYKARISPADLLQKINSGENIVILDLRHPLDSVTDERTLPGAIRVMPADVTARAAQLPKNRDIILYCT